MDIHAEKNRGQIVTTQLRISVLSDPPKLLDKEKLIANFHVRSYNGLSRVQHITMLCVLFSYVSEENLQF